MNAWGKIGRAVLTVAVPVLIVGVTFAVIVGSILAGVG